jgi:DNA polymerase I-like protein with 3'-5' exonuclease and polymerase domains/uracil-DNA glycosylase
MLVGESWGAEEERTGLPFQGLSGQELNRMLHEAGIMRSECYTTNVVNARPPYNDIERWVTKKRKDITPDMKQLRDRWVAPVVLDGFKRLLREIDEVQPNMIIALGNVALWALTGASGISKWRGSQLQLDVPWELWPADLTQRPRPLPKPNVIPTFHPALVLYDASNRAISVHDLKRAARLAPYKEYPNVPKWKFVVRPTLGQVMQTLSALLDRLRSGDELWLDFDLETRAGHIACAGLSWSLTDALCIPFMCVEDWNGYWSAEEEAAIVYALYQVLTHPKVRVRWQNGLYDAQYTYRHWHFVPNGAQDTMIAHHSAFCGLPKSLAYQASMYCDHYVYWKDDGKTWDKNVSEDQLWRYNGVDCVRTREVGEGATATLEALGLQEVDKFQQAMFWPILQCMQRGVRVDHKRRARLAEELMHEMEKRQAYFEYVLGHALNPASKTQMQTLFYEDLKQKPIYARAKKGKPGGITVGKEALQTLWTREPLLRPLINAIREYRSLGVFLKTFAMAPLDYDGRMRTSYNICGTTSYRLASRKNAFGSGTNLQNVPKGDEASESELDAEEPEEEEDEIDLTGLRLPNIRKIFVPDPGREIFDKDLSKADLRIVTWESDEPEMKAMLKEGKDPYVEIAREFYKDPSIKKTNPDGTENPKYRTFKSFAHGTHYLGTPYGLAARLGLTVHQAERTQAWYLGRMKRIAEWQREFCDALRSRRYVENIFGYRRYYFGRIDDATCREAIAWVPQSTVALYINKIWKNIYDRYPHIEVLLQVHDSLVGQYPLHRRAECLAQLDEASQIVLPYDDPLVIPSGTKTSSISWGDC